MTNRQNSHLRMFINVQIIFRDYPDKWNAAPALAGIISKLDEYLAAIQTLNREIAIKAKGTKLKKDNLRKSLSEKAVAISGTLKAYALMNNDKVLAKKVHLTKTHLRNLREMDISRSINNLIQTGRENLPKMKEYAFNEESLNSLEMDMNQFNKMIGRPAQILATRNAKKKELKKVFAKTNLLLKNQLDNLMTQFKYTDPEFYELYKRSRVIYG